MRWLLLFTLGCGRIEFAPRSDAATDTSDAAPVTCWSAWAGMLPPLGAPTLVAELDTFGIEHDMALTADGLHLYFSSDRTGTLGGDDLWLATRPDRDALFTTIDHVPSLSSPTSEGAFFTRDGLTGLLAAELPGGEGLSDVWRAQRGSLADPFTVTQDGLGNLNGAGADYDTWVSSDGLTLYYSSQQQLLTATRSSTTVGWGGPVAVAGVNTGAEWDPSLSEDGRVIVFTSNRLSPLRDIFVATRPSTTVAFGAPEPITILNSPDSDFDPHVTPDGCAIYFASDRGRSLGDLTIYVSRVTL